MLAIGDIYVFATDFVRALRFYRDGLGLCVVAADESALPPVAVLDFSDGGGSSVRLFGGAQAWQPGERPDLGRRPTVRFDVITDEFDATLAQLLAHGGTQNGEIETFQGTRVATVADPDGNTFDLIEVPGDDD